MISNEREQERSTAMAAIDVPVDINNVLQNMEFNAESRVQLVNVAHYGMTFDSIVDYQVSEDFESLYASLHKPGGTATGNGGAQIIDSEVFVQPRACNAFMIGCYIARHAERMGRAHNHALYTRDRLREWRGYHLAEDQYVPDPEEHPILEKETESAIVDFIEEFTGILSN